MELGAAIKARQWLESHKCDEARGRRRAARGARCLVQLDSESRGRVRRGRRVRRGSAGPCHGASCLFALSAPECLVNRHLQGS